MDTLSRKRLVDGTYCAEVSSPASARKAQHEAASLPGMPQCPPSPHLKTLLVTQTPDGFHLERLTEDGASPGNTQHDTLDEASQRAYSAYHQLSDWRFLPRRCRSTELSPGAIARAALPIYVRRR